MQDPQVGMGRMEKYREALYYATAMDHYKQTVRCSVHSGHGGVDVSWFPCCVQPNSPGVYISVHPPLYQDLLVHTKTVESGGRLKLEDDIQTE